MSSEITFLNNLLTTTPGVYNASKAGLQSWSESLRLELQPFGVNVVSLVTGSVSTNLLTHPDIRLPEDSLYLKAADRIQARGAGQDVKSKDSPSVFAQKVVGDVLGGARGLVWRGKAASVICFLSKIAPMWLMVSDFPISLMDRADGTILSR